MHVRLLNLATPLLFGAALFAQGPQTSPAEAWKTFLSTNGSDWRAEWLPGTGTPNNIWGTGLRLSSSPITTVEQARQHAEAVLARFSDLLGQGPTTFVEDVQSKTLKVWTFGYEQYYKGLPCIDGWVRLMINDCGVLALMGSSALPVPYGMSTTPTVGADQARWVAYEHAGITPAKPGLLARRANTDKLVVWGNIHAPQFTSPRLAWEIKVRDLSQKKVGRVYVDAQTGVVLQYANDLHTCGFDVCPHNDKVIAKAAAEEAREIPFEVSHGATVPGAVDVSGNVSGWVNIGVGPNDPPVLVPMENLLVTIVGGNSAYTDTAGNFNITNAGNTPVTLNIVFTGRYCATVLPSQGTQLNLNVPATPGTPVNVTLYSSTPAEHDLAQINAYWGIDDINQFYRSFGGTPSATYDGLRATTSLPQDCNAFYTGFTVNFYHASSCVNTSYQSVIYHECGHGLDDDNGGIVQVDGLSEGSADFISIAMLDDPILGKDFFGPGTFVRTALNTRTYPAGGGVHQQGETWMGWGWDVYVNLQASIGNPAALQLFRAFSVGQFAPDPQNQPGAVLVVFVLDDDNGNLLDGTPHCRELDAACVKRTLPNPVLCAGTPYYYPYGQGCAGSGLQPCIFLNNNGGTLNSATSTNEYAYEAVAPASPASITVTGFTLFSAATGSATTTSCSLYLDNTATSGPQLLPVAAGTITIGTTPALYAATLSPPTTIPAGAKFYIAVWHGTNSAPSNLASGTAGNAFSRFSSSSTALWSGPFTTFVPGYEIICTTGNTPGAKPQLSNVGVPKLNTTFSVNLDRAKPTAPAALFFGGSNSTWAQFGLTLPFDLTFLGAPQCFILASGEVQLGFVTDANGQGGFSVNVPNVPALVDQKFYNQYVVLDNFNSLGVVLSNGGEGRVGN